MKLATGRGEGRIREIARPFNNANRSERKRRFVRGLVPLYRLQLRLCASGASSINPETKGLHKPKRMQAWARDDANRFVSEMSAGRIGGGGRTPGDSPLASMNPEAGKRRLT